jgi:hypothetical protein
MLAPVEIDDTEGDGVWLWTEDGPADRAPDEPASPIPKPPYGDGGTEPSRRSAGAVTGEISDRIGESISMLLRSMSSALTSSIRVIPSKPEPAINESIALGYENDCWGSIPGNAVGTAVLVNPTPISFLLMPSMKMLKSPLSNSSDGKGGSTSRSKYSCSRYTTSYFPLLIMLHHCIHKVY